MARQPDIQYIRFYTDGSAARKVAMPEPMKTMRLPRQRRQKRITLHIDPVAMLGIVTAIVMTVLILTGMAKLDTAKEQRAAMEQYVAVLRTENETLQNAYDSGYDLEEVERMALALGMIPKEQATHIPIRVDTVQEQVQLSLWQRFFAFLTGSVA